MLRSMLTARQISSFWSELISGTPGVCERYMPDLSYRTIDQLLAAIVPSSTI